MQNLKTSNPDHWKFAPEQKISEIFSAISSKNAVLAQASFFAIVQANGVNGFTDNWVFSRFLEFFQKILEFFQNFLSFLRNKVEFSDWPNYFFFGFEIKLRLESFELHEIVLFKLKTLFFIMKCDSLGYTAQFQFTEKLVFLDFLEFFQKILEFSGKFSLSSFFRGAKKKSLT